MFHSHLNVLKALFCVFQKVGESRKYVFALFFGQALDLQTFFSKMTMLHQSKAILWEENEFNPLIRIWCKIFTSAILNHKISKFIKLVEIVTLQVLGFVEDECTFNTINFMKARLGNQLNPHMDFCTKFYNQQFFIIQNFSYE